MAYEVIDPREVSQYYNDKAYEKPMYRGEEYIGPDPGEYPANIPTSYDEFYYVESPEQFRRWREGNPMQTLPSLQGQGGGGGGTPSITLNINWGGDKKEGDVYENAMPVSTYDAEASRSQYIRQNQTLSGPPPLAIDLPGVIPHEPYPWNTRDEPYPWNTRNEPYPWNPMSRPRSNTQEMGAGFADMLQGSQGPTTMPLYVPPWDPGRGFDSSARDPFLNTVRGPR